MRLDNGFRHRQPRVTRESCAKDRQYPNRTVFPVALSTNDNAAYNSLSVSKMNQPAICLLLLVGLASSSARAQSSTVRESATSSRAQSIVASFNKKKDVVKERHGVRVEKFREIRTTLATTAHLHDFSGAYEEVNLASSLNLSIDDAGTVSGSGADAVDASEMVFRKFTIRNGRLDGSLLTATKVYAGGATSSMEGVFINSTSFDGPADKGVTSFGLGVIGAPVQLGGGVTMEKFFYQRKR